MSKKKKKGKRGKTPVEVQSHGKKRGGKGKWMPVKITKTDGKYKVTHGGKTSAKATTKKKAEAQERLLRGVAHGWKPTGRKKK